MIILRREIMTATDLQTSQSWRSGPEVSSPIVFHIKRSSDNAHQSRQWGTTGTDRAVPADYDGDGLADIAIFSYAGGNWQISWKAQTASLEMSISESAIFRSVHCARISMATVHLAVEITEPDAVVTAADPRPTWQRPEVTADDRRLPALVAQSLDDLQSLRMAMAASPGDTFLAAGVPWFFTLFGRDSLWAARMLLPLGTDLALGTLRTLAAQQGTRTDPAAEEEPGKILHEVRRGVFDDGMGLRLPPVYYGTVDATPLWICLLHDAWRWGLPPADIEPLLPALQAALGWIETAAQAGDGFLSYIDRSGTGLANQGWKDSGDAARFARRPPRRRSPGSRRSPGLRL